MPAQDAMVPLHPFVQGIAAHITATDDGKVRLPDAAFGEAVEGTVARVGKDKEAVAESVLALALRAAREGGEAAHPLIAQLAVLVTLLLGSDAAGQALGALPLSSSAQAAIGAQASNIPVSARGPGGGSSALQVRLGKTPPKPKD